LRQYVSWRHRWSMRCKLLGMPSGWLGCVPRIESRMAQARVLQIIGERDAVGVAGRSGYGMVARMAAAVALIGAGEARNRVAAAEALAPRQSLIGETLAPRCPATAAAFAAGEISSAAVRIVTDAMRRIPAGVHPRPRSSRPWPGMPAGSNPAAGTDHSPGAGAPGSRRAATHRGAATPSAGAALRPNDDGSLRLERAPGQRGRRDSADRAGFAQRPTPGHRPDRARPAHPAPTQRQRPGRRLLHVAG
jgi:hypothetical protein